MTTKHSHEEAHAAPVQKPSVGRIVHYCEADGQPSPAIVIKVVDDDTCDLHIFNAAGGRPALAVKKRSDTPVAGCWNWPPKV